MTLVEYLYVDTRRLDTYLDQFAAPVAYDKVPTWKAGIGLTGPEATVSQDRHPRTRTMHEKAELLLKHIQKTAEMSQGRLRAADLELDSPQPFRMETCIATRAFML